MSAIFYHPDAYSTHGPKLMGRNVAGDSFLRGFFKFASPRESLFAQVSTEDHGRGFAELFKRHGRSENLRIFSNQNLSAAAEAKLVYHPDPEIGTHAYRRSLYSNDSWSLCGITHTTSSAAAMDAISEWITAPVQPWDAVICTSTAVKNNVETILQAQANALEMRLGIQKLCLPQMPVIPLGVHTDDFHYSEKDRIDSRKKLGVSDDTIIVLYVGRLSFHGKAHPLAMYQALESASRTAGKKITLIECGWHANEQIGKAFNEGAQVVSPSLDVITLDGRMEENRKRAWSSADIFCSLPDNIQETFGIVPLEAMSAGLPVVVSDWDGYKDTVREGIDGFRIPTLAPAPGLAGDLAHRHALEIDTYDMYIGHTSTLVAIDLDKLARSFLELIKSPELRRRMGEAGRQRAVQNYDWRSIICRYEELWEEQSRIRDVEKQRLQDGGNAAKNGSTRTTWPARLDPTIAFANYATQHMTLTSKLTLTEKSAEHSLHKFEQYKRLAMVNFASYVFPTDSEIRSVFEIAERNLPNSTAAESLLQNTSVPRRPYVLRGLVWLCKLGLLQFT